MKERRVSDIIGYLQENKMASLDALCDSFGVSKNTVRRDVSELVNRGLVHKVYGGIVLNDGVPPLGDPKVIPYLSRMNEDISAKQLIGRLAAALVEDGDTVFIDAGTTVPNMLPHIAGRHNLHIVTNSLCALNEAKRFGLETYCLGGEYMPNTDSFAGALSALQDVHITKAFMGASLMDISGATNYSYHEAEMKRAVISKADKTIIMAAGSKFGRAATIVFCPMDRVSSIVSDQEPPPEFFPALHDYGIQLLCGGKEEAPCEGGP